MSGLSVSIGIYSLRKNVCVLSSGVSVYNIMKLGSISFKGISDFLSEEKVCGKNVVCVLIYESFKLIKVMFVNIDMILKLIYKLLYIKFKVYVWWVGYRIF